MKGRGWRVGAEREGEEEGEEEVGREGKVAVTCCGCGTVTAEV